MHSNNKNIKLPLYYKTEMIMNVQADLKWILEELQDVKDPSLLKAIKNILKYRKKVVSKHDTIESYNLDIDQGIAEIENGEFYTQEEARKIANKW